MSIIEKKSRRKFQISYIILENIKFDFHLWFRKQDVFQEIFQIFYPVQTQQNPRLQPVMSVFVYVCVWLSVCMCVCVCVCVCVFVCVCVYVFILFHRKSFFLCTNFLDILERDGSTILCCDCYIRLFYHVPSSPFLRMSYFTSKAKLQQLKNWREYDLIYCPRGRRYILM